MLLPDSGKVLNAGKAEIFELFQESIHVSEWICCADTRENWSVLYDR